ncbi:hypothetical protein [Bacillus methanolicus]|uniref:Abortive phage infection protein n=1 Tax=Bacillus methanolicus (strain MGA3 / ATCC 53907) TaxID=796606 RepID=I3DYR0_BACMM|nr:hypothetical protein [Bacillus methanolicus]AIE59457.1 hypothetical protein BMMGA3_05135 [Bacillus methanolicus MGA3]EIJ79381.1 hypothetical protein MGA3_13536 [Bacillus methanolicus MGA3]UQD51522.1 hypothetical protein C0971_05425 [Bacillus methanolicus]
MNEEKMINEVLDKLKNGEISEYYVSKDKFLSFRSVLVKRPDFKHFRGIAQRGGDVIYRYLETPRS